MHSSFLLTLGLALSVFAAPAALPEEHLERRQLSGFTGIPSLPKLGNIPNVPAATPILPGAGTTGTPGIPGLGKRTVTWLKSILSKRSNTGADTANVEKRQLFGIPGFTFPGFPRTSTTSTTSARTTSTAATTTTTRSSTTTTTTTATATPVSTPISTSSTSTRTTSATAATGTAPNTGSSRNELVNGACKAVTVIYARGTGESGNVGSVAGPPMFNSLTTKLGAANVAFQGVDYAATTAGFSGDSAGNAKVAELVNLAATQCPSTKIVVSGYSQGCMVTHRGVSQVTASLASTRIYAAVMFGDPFNNQALSNVALSKTKFFCHSGDSVCESGSAQVTSAHTNYNIDADEAASFIVSKVS